MVTPQKVPDPPGLPPGRPVELPGRGTTFVRHLDGPAGAPTVVLLHGWTVNAALNWFAAFEPLAEHVNVVALDHRGHGRGIRTWRRFRLEDCADDVAALADQLDIERIIPIGYSMGGPIAQLVWRRHPDRVDGLVLCATSRNFGTGGAGGRAMVGMAGMASLMARATPRRVHRTLGDRLLDVRFDQSDLGRWARQQVIQNDTRMVVEAGQALAGFSSRNWIGDVDVPTAVVVTQLDSTVPPHRQRRLADAIPGATIHPVAGDHGVCSTDPAVFVPGLVAACRSVVARGRGGTRRRQAG